jgi:hypothetical protein
MLRRVALVKTDISEDHIASMFRMKESEIPLVCSDDVPHGGREEDPYCGISTVVSIKLQWICSDDVPHGGREEGPILRYLHSCDYKLQWR